VSGDRERLGHDTLASSGRQLLSCGSALVRILRRVRNSRINV
jgi:hypothetical protein